VTASSGTTTELFDWQTPPATPAVEHELTTVHATGDITSDAPETTFIPSAGALVEETLDEEDYNTTLHASSIEEMDDFEEEETLEGAADLGTMIREMSIDQITRSGHVDEEEEDDLEEEDSIHDPTIGDLDVSGEDEDEEGDLDESDTEEDVIHEDFAEGSEAQPDGFDQAEAGVGLPVREPSREEDRGRGRRDGRRDGRRFGRGDRSGRPRQAGGAGDRDRSGGGRDRRGGRSSMQSTNLPAISELLKPGQEILVQIAKEPIAKKGARITSHIALPGRFLVFMPTVNHTGVSRKIESDGERRRLKEILLSEKGDAGGGFIVRTAAEGATEEELRSDLRFLLNLWADIKSRSESSKSPALIYHDLNLVERILRDQVTDNFSAIWVDTETDYERILRFLQRFQPSLIRRVKLYTKETPLFEQFGITEEINKALRSKVWLKSGGSIVINQTEALVAIDINTGKFVGKTARLEDTIVKTNLDAIPEIVRQIRLRDLGGIIIIDFIDMDERKNRNRVMAALEEELKTDRAPSKVLQFNDFGLVAITRKRVKQSLERTLSTTCNVCVGTGMVKSPVTVCNDIYIEMRKMQKHLDRGDVMLRVNPEVVKQLKAPGTRWLQEMEEMVGKTILVKSDPSLHPEQFDIH
jgi:ribonuclease G